MEKYEYLRFTKMVLTKSIERLIVVQDTHEYMSNIHKISSASLNGSECWASLIGISIASSFRPLFLLRFEGSDCKSVSIAESLSWSCWAECVLAIEKVDHVGTEPELEG